MPDLAVNETAFGVDSVGDALPARPLFWCKNPANAGVTRGLSYSQLLQMKFNIYETYHAADVGCFGNLKAAFACPLAIVLDHSVAADEHSIGDLLTSHPRQRSLNNSMLKLQGANLDWCEENGVGKRFETCG